MNNKFNRTQEEQELFEMAHAINNRVVHLEVVGSTIFWWLDTVSIETRQRISCDTRFGFDWSVKKLALFAERNK